MITGLRVEFSGRELRRHLATKIKDLQKWLEAHPEPGDTATQLINGAPSPVSSLNVHAIKTQGTPFVATSSKPSMNGNGRLHATIVRDGPRIHRDRLRKTRELETLQFWHENIDETEMYRLSVEEMATLQFEVPTQPKSPWADIDVPPSLSAEDIRAEDTLLERTADTLIDRAAFVWDVCLTHPELYPGEVFDIARAECAKGNWDGVVATLYPYLPSDEQDWLAVALRTATPSEMLPSKKHVPEESA